MVSQILNFGLPSPIDVQVIGPRPLFTMPAGGSASALTDQRLAGLFMMLVDLVVLLPMIGRLTEAHDRRVDRVVEGAAFAGQPRSTR